MGIRIPTVFEENDAKRCAGCGEPISGTPFRVSIMDSIAREAPPTWAERASFNPGPHQFHADPEHFRAWARRRGLLPLPAVRGPGADAAGAAAHRARDLGCLRRAPSCRARVPSRLTPAQRRRPRTTVAVAGRPDVMDLTIVIPALTAILAAIFSLALLDQWLERRHPYQAVWCLGMAFFAIASGCEALAAANGWSEPVYRVWYLTGAVWTAGWLGLGNAFLLGRTRFGYGFALCLFLAGLFTFLTPRRFPAEYPGVGITPLVYFVIAGGLAFLVATATYFQDWRWPRLAALAVVGATVLSIVLMVGTDAAPAGLLDRSGHGCSDRRDPARPAAAADAVHERHGRVRAHPGRPVLGVGVHAQAAGAGVLARPGPAGRAVPVQPHPVASRHQRELHRLAAGCGPCPVRRPAQQPGARPRCSSPLGALVPTITDSLNRFGSTQLYSSWAS